MSKYVWLTLIASTVLLSACDQPTINQPPLNAGLTFQQLEIGQDKIYLTQIDPTKLNLQIVQNTDKEQALNLQQIHQQNHSVFSFNGGFFSEKFEPTGLLISQGQELSPLIKADLIDGVFTINQNNQPKLYQYHQYKKLQSELKLQFAIQNGPILIDDQGNIAIDNKIVKKANRTAIGITKDNQVVVIIDRQTILDTDKSPTLYQFADLIKNSSELKQLGIHSVLNLDGGPSTSLSINDQYFPELEKIQNIIITKPSSDQ